MAFLTTLFSALARKVGDLLQAIFGWSIAAIFGRLSKKRQVLISIALIFSLFWPLFVLGAFVPRAAAFIIAFVPVKGLVAARVLRIIWISLAVLSPVVVGLLTRAVSPEARQKSLPVSLLNGYPLTLGFAISFLITLVTVPLVKLGSIVRRWTDDHVYVQARKGRYEDVMRSLCQACLKAGLDPQISEVPVSLALSTRVIHFFSRGAIESLMISRPQRIVAKDVQLFLYPADLLVRGKPRAVARVRAMMNRTHLERDAWLVSSDAAQRIQDELGRLWEAIERHPTTAEIGPGLETRLVEVASEASETEITFDEWVLLDRLAQRVEQKLNNYRSTLEEAGVKSTSDEARMSKELEKSLKQSSAVAPGASEQSTRELAETAFREARELITLEVALAREELRKELKDTVKAAIGFGAAAALAVVMISMFGVAIVLAAGGTAGIAVLVGLGFLVVAAIAAGVAYSMVPKKPLARSRAHVADDINQLREHVA